MTAVATTAARFRAAPRDPDEGVFEAELDLLQTT
jgi:hypothetical protein